MRIIKVNAINSTNEFARDLYRGNTNFQPVCVVAHTQQKGKGQRGSGWLSNPGENLTFSVLYPHANLAIEDQFLLNAAVALAIADILEQYEIPKVKVKWPNDIMSANYKLCGILIENILNNSQISASILGVGLNVNQMEFLNLPRAGSMQQMSGRNFNLDSLLEDVLDSLNKRLKLLSKPVKNALLEEYTSKMFKKNMVSAFELPDGSHMTGIIRGVTREGRLYVETEYSVFKTFDLKEIKLLF
ncbi:biotin--[acetyl-CoA-carboxylase] ligase [Salegentibacter sp. F188]|uniref:Biotin--[acetyl-CoA-carboxylase] ligase n=1 Tax=Autumnicola patrickiae TaxID=3075591 RepID=A0ABU3DYX3_9FLAO|nr:biotin--[acetyl-CoA-carboxylase] ligase [Salegentibacter sp. F188]MDT0688873.1 biotin--[acetyl-CoA-carboxylase] ligase [Salegentibacter sp. F188]